MATRPTRTIIRFPFILNPIIRKYIEGGFPFLASLEKQKLWILRQEMIVRHAALGGFSDQELKRLDIKQLSVTLKAVRETLGIKAEAPIPHKERPGDPLEGKVEDEHRRNLEDAKKKMEDNRNGTTGNVAVRSAIPGTTGVNTTLGTLIGGQFQNPEPTGNGTSVPAPDPDGRTPKQVRDDRRNEAHGREALAVILGPGASAAGDDL